MFLVNGIKATLIQYNRNNEDSIYDDEDQTTTTIKICPYNIDNDINFGTYTTPEATGYFITKRQYDVKEGDQIEFQNKTYTILRVMDGWQFNRIENYVLAVR